jgi:hypothetical protein
MQRTFAQNAAAVGPNINVEINVETLCLFRAITNQCAPPYDSRSATARMQVNHRLSENLLALGPPYGLCRWQRHRDDFKVFECAMSSNITT